jgi:hypothetical protein
MNEEKPERLIGDRIYDSDALDAVLRQNSPAVIASHRRNRVESRAHNGRPQPRYERLWVVKRFTEIPWQCRLQVRGENDTEIFLGFEQLASITILLTQF